MTIQHRGSVFEFNDASPGDTVSGSKSRSAHCWKFCPYSAQSTSYNQDSRIPEGDKRYHPETEGQMHTYSIGARTAGWVCADNNCSFFLGTFAATTTGIAVTQEGRSFTAFPTSPDGNCPQDAESLAVLSGTVNNKLRGRKIVPGTRYLEI